MKKKNLIISIGIILVVLVIGVVILLLNNDNEKETYSEVILDGYKFSLNDKYKYSYDNEKKEGTFKSDMFPVSYIFSTDLEYSSLISTSSKYTDMGAKELDSSIEEVKFGTYEGFINSKKILYEDTKKEYNLVIILIKVEKEKTLVFQYEVSYEENHESILKDIKNSLSGIEKV